MGLAAYGGDGSMADSQGAGATVVVMDGAARGQLGLCQPLLTFLPLITMSIGTLDPRALDSVACHCPQSHNFNFCWPGCSLAGWTWCGAACLTPLS